MTRLLTALLSRLPLLALLCLLAVRTAAAPDTAPGATVTVTQIGETFSVDAMLTVQVTRETAWEVLTDFDHMSAILGNLTSSKVIRREGNTWIVRQEGVARYGWLAFSFESEREIRLEPIQRIRVRTLSGTVKRMESDTQLLPLGQGVQIKYHAESVPDSILARMFGLSFIRHEVEEQFLLMAAEMLRRHGRAAPAATATPSD